MVAQPTKNECRARTRSTRLQVRITVGMGETSRLNPAVPRAWDSIGPSEKGAVDPLRSCAGPRATRTGAPARAPTLALRSRLDWQVVRRLDGRLQGDYRTLLRGDGTDFLDLRAYQWGDDVRHIDWNATARMDQLLVRDFMEDRELTAWLVIDRSRSMTFGPAGRTKEHVLCELAAVFGQLLVRNGNRVGAIIFDGERHWVLPPRQGRNHVLVLLHHLLRPVEAAASTDLSDGLRDPVPPTPWYRRRGGGSLPRRGTAWRRVRAREHRYGAERRPRFALAPGRRHVLQSISVQPDVASQLGLNRFRIWSHSTTVRGGPPPPGHAQRAGSTRTRGGPPTTVPPLVQRCSRARRFQSAHVESAPRPSRSRREIYSPAASLSWALRHTS